MTSQLHSSYSDRSTTNFMDGFPDAVLIVDQDGQLLDSNRSARKLFGATLDHQQEVDVSRLIRFGGHESVSFTDLLDEKPGVPIPCTVLGLKHRKLEARFGPYQTMDTSRNWVLTIRDTTDRESEERRFRESVKMEAVRSLASHVGNDFNNVLAALSGRLEAANQHLPDEVPQAISELANARADLKRAARVVRQLQRVSQSSPGRKQPTDPKSLIEDAIASIKHEYSGDLSLHTVFEHGDAALIADAQQIGDVLVSVLQNARDATPAGGDITIRTSLLQAGPNEPVPVDHHGQDFIRIDIEDTGRGIPSNVMPRIFEPFFTTKSHHGAGLGLAGVYEALKKHEGGLAVESAVGIGTTFSVYLPTGQRAPAADPEKKGSEPKDETVLVIDDEASVRNIVRKALQRVGYNVLVATDGDEGLEIIARQGDEIDLIILDIVMPRVSGWDVLKALKERDHSPPVIVQSGYAAGEAIDTSVDADGFLGKPYDLIDLTTLVRRVLDGNTEVE